MAHTGYRVKHTAGLVCVKGVHIDRHVTVYHRPQRQSLEPDFLWRKKTKQKEHLLVRYSLTFRYNEKHMTSEILKCCVCPLMYCTISAIRQNTTKQPWVFTSNEREAQCSDMESTTEDLSCASVK